LVELQGGSSPTSGHPWHAEFWLRDRTVGIRPLWHEADFASIRPMLVHLRADSPWRVGLTFSAVDNASALSDAIGKALDVVLDVSATGFMDEAAQLHWTRRAANLDNRIHIKTCWNLDRPESVPMDVFGAAGGTELLPRW
jgi:hypothetical protein